MTVVVVNSHKWGHNLLLEQLPHHLAGYRFTSIGLNSPIFTMSSSGEQIQQTFYDLAFYLCFRGQDQLSRD